VVGDDWGIARDAEHCGQLQGGDVPVPSSHNGLGDDDSDRLIMSDEPGLEVRPLVFPSKDARVEFTRVEEPQRAPEPQGGATHGHGPSIAAHEREQSSADGEIEPPKIGQRQVAATVDVGPQIEVIGPHPDLDHRRVVRPQPISLPGSSPHSDESEPQVHVHLPDTTHLTTARARAQEAKVVQLCRIGSPVMAAVISAVRSTAVAGP